MVGVPSAARAALGWVVGFPRVTAVQVHSIEDSVQQIARETGLQLEVSSKVATFKHAVTKYRITLEVYRTCPQRLKTCCAPDALSVCHLR